MLTLAEWCARWHIPPQAIRELVAPDNPVTIGGDASEANVQVNIRLAAAALGVTLWRNNSGAHVDASGRQVRYGLGNDSKRLNAAFKSADLIGLTGTGRFVAVECKAGSWRYVGNEREQAQSRFLSHVKASGGAAGFATSVDDFRKIIYSD